MKKFNLFIAAAAIFGMSASAENTINLHAASNEITVAPGAQFQLPLLLDTNCKIRDFQLEIKLPEGMSVAKNGKKYAITYSEDCVDVYNDIYKVTARPNGKGNFAMIGYTDNEEWFEYCIQPGDNQEFATLTIDNACEVGEYTIDVIDIAMTHSYTDGTVDDKGKLVQFVNELHSPDFAVKVIVKDASGIENVVVAGQENDGAYYDLMGRRVANPVAGVYVHNGKKVLVK